MTGWSRGSRLPRRIVPRESGAATPTPHVIPPPLGLTSAEVPPASSEAAPGAVTPARRPAFFKGNWGEEHPPGDERVGAARDVLREIAHGGALALFVDEVEGVPADSMAVFAVEVIDALV